MTEPCIKFRCPACGKPAALVYHVETKTVVHKSYVPVYAINIDTDEDGKEAMFVLWDGETELEDPKAKTTKYWYSCSVCGETFSDEEKLYKLWENGNLEFGSPDTHADFTRLCYRYKQGEIEARNFKILYRHRNQQIEQNLVTLTDNG